MVSLASSLKVIKRSRAVILLPQPMQSRAHPEPRLPATEMCIQSLNLRLKQRFLYLFDYGDEWQFEVEYIGEGTSEEVRYPRIVDLRGESPQQYSDCYEG